MCAVCNWIEKLGESSGRLDPLKGVLMKVASSARIAGAIFLFTILALAQGPFPATIVLPDGWQPEGLAIGNGKTFYAGSRATGAVQRISWG